MLEKAARFLPGLDPEGGREWMGYRPSLPDSLPVIGRSRSAAERPSTPSATAISASPRPPPPVALVRELVRWGSRLRDRSWSAVFTAPF
jgi:glycine/D-amino acid oxidase-like deaminating enzyme